MKKQFVFLFYALLTATTLFSFTGKSIAADPTPIALPKDLPADLKLPDNEIVFLKLHAEGMQNYICREGQGWVFTEPVATLYDDKKVAVGRHSIGPSWVSTVDDSWAIGQAVKSFEPKNKNNIPWRLFTAKDHRGSGVFSDVTSILQVKTQGGKVPSSKPCSTVYHFNRTFPAQYKATYYFSKRKLD